LLKRFTPAVMAFSSDGQAFNVRSTDLWWQLCVLTLMHSCDIIVVDLTWVKAGTDWELLQLRSRGLMAKCLFVVADNERGSVKSTIDKHFHEIEPPEVHTYGPNGAMINREGFSAKFDTALERTFTPPNIRHRCKNPC